VAQVLGCASQVVTGVWLPVSCASQGMGRGALGLPTARLGNTDRVAGNAEPRTRRAWTRRRHGERRTRRTGRRSRRGGRRTRHGERRSGHGERRTRHGKRRSPLAERRTRYGGRRTGNGERRSRRGGSARRLILATRWAFRQAHWSRLALLRSLGATHWSWGEAHCPCREAHPAWGETQRPCGETHKARVEAHKPRPVRGSVWLATRPSRLQVSAVCGAQRSWSSDRLGLVSDRPVVGTFRTGACCRNPIWPLTTRRTA
jgi:hypothetical protein